MTEETKPFTVSDRRHFTPEGVARDEASSGQAPSPEPGVPSRGADDASRQEPPVDFSGFILSLGAQAAALLSGDVAPTDKAEALREARALISILEMLKDKTEGRRDEDEERVLEGLLYELRMAYVTAARAAGA